MLARSVLERLRTDTRSVFSMVLRQMEETALDKLTQDHALGNRAAAARFAMWFALGFDRATARELALLEPESVATDLVPNTDQILGG